MKIATVRTFAIGLGEVTEEPHHNFSSYRYRGKIFVTVPPDEEHIHVFPAGNVREQFLAMYPEFMEKLLWGGKVVGVRINLAKAEPSAVKSVVRAAFEFKSQAATPRKRAPSEQGERRKVKMRGTASGA
jgi:hypothetical protein